MEERNEIPLGIRISKRLNDQLVAEQRRKEKETGLKLSLNQVVRLLLEKGLQAKIAKAKR